MTTNTQSEKRAELVSKLEELDVERTQLWSELVQVGRNQTLPGSYLVVEAAGASALVAAQAVHQLVPLVECMPVADAPEHVVGTFLWRGEPVVGVDLASYLKRPRELPLDAHVLIIGTQPLVGLVVDRVRSIVEAPLLMSERAEGLEHLWERSSLVIALCRTGDQLVPLIDPAVLVKGLEVPAR